MGKTGSRNFSRVGSDLSPLASSLVCALGGIQRTSKLYAEYLGEGDRDPDNYRDLFRDVCNGARRPHLSTTFQLGDFFGRHVRWMSPLMTLYVADFFEMYAALLLSAAPAFGVELCTALIEDLPRAVAPHPRDLPPFMAAPGGQRKDPAWAQFLLDCSKKHPESFSPRNPSALQFSVKEYDELARRQSARSKCIMTAKQKRRLCAIFRSLAHKRGPTNQSERYTPRRGTSLEDTRREVIWHLKERLLPRPPLYWGEFGMPSG